MWEPRSRHLYVRPVGMSVSRSRHCVLVAPPCVRVRVGPGPCVHARAWGLGLACTLMCGACAVCACVLSSICVCGRVCVSVSGPRGHGYVHACVRVQGPAVRARVLASVYLRPCMRVCASVRASVRSPCGSSQWPGAWGPCAVLASPWWAPASEKGGDASTQGLYEAPPPCVSRLLGAPTCGSPLPGRPLVSVFRGCRSHPSAGSCVLVELWEGGSLGPHAQPRQGLASEKRGQSISWTWNSGGIGGQGQACPESKMGCGDTRPGSPSYGAWGYSQSSPQLLQHRAETVDPRARGPAAPASLLLMCGCPGPALYPPPDQRFGLQEGAAAAAPHVGVGTAHKSAAQAHADVEPGGPQQG